MECIRCGCFELDMPSYPGWPLDFDPLVEIIALENVIAQENVNVYE
jgi:hypothetical protein